MSVLVVLERAIDARDSVALEGAVNQVDPVHIDDPRIVPILCNLLVATWHYRHEDVAHLLQRIRDPRASRALAAAATLKFAYLDCDDSYAFARKCTWALADIGTDEAKQLLVDLSNGDDETLAGYAMKRLVKWQAEAGRKGNLQPSKHRDAGLEGGTTVRSGTRQSTKEIAPVQPNQKTYKPGQWIVLGVVLGALIGLLLEKFAIGLIFGFFVGIVIDSAKRKAANAGRRGGTDLGAKE